DARPRGGGAEAPFQSFDAANAGPKPVVVVHHRGFLAEQEAPERTRHAEHYPRPDSTKGGRESANRERSFQGNSTKNTRLGKRSSARSRRAWRVVISSAAGVFRDDGNARTSAPLPGTLGPGSGQGENALTPWG